MRRAAGLVVPAIVALAGCGSSEDDGGARFDPFTEVRDRAVTRPARASPRWEHLATLSGSGPARKAFTVAGGAIQWRARWRCQTGRLRLSRAGRRIVDAACPATGTATDVRTGTIALAVQASGPWRVVLEQQVDTPLREPPLPAMRSPRARVIAAGRFYALERSGRGRASLHRLSTGRLALRFDGFATSPNTDLFVWLSSAARPRDTVRAAGSPHTVLRALKATLGEQNYLIPADVKAGDIRSVVIWCVPVRIAYTAAALRATRPATARGRSPSSTASR